MPTPDQTAGWAVIGLADALLLTPGAWYAAGRRLQAQTAAEEVFF